MITAPKDGNLPPKSPKTVLKPRLCVKRPLCSMSVVRIPASSNCRHATGRGAVEMFGKEGAVFLVARWT